MSKWLTVLCTALVWCCYFCSIPAATSVANNEADRVALLAFKAAIVEDPFGALSSWNHSLYYCHWNGILCSRLHPERVIGLTLMSQGLVGSLSPHIGNLSFLKSIILHNNSFHGPIPQEMGRLFRLQTIEFSYNLFGGGIPNNLSRCSRLERLNFTHNNLTGNIPTELGSLSRLRTLALYTNKISEYGMGDMASTLGDVYSFGILLLEMFTGKKPTDDMFKDHLNLHNFVKNALPDRVMEIVDPCILLEHNTKRWIKDCMVFILRIGVACSMESPRDRMEMGSVISELCKIKNTYMNEGLNQD